MQGDSRHHEQRPLYQMMNITAISNAISKDISNANVNANANANANTMTTTTTTTTTTTATTTATTSTIVPRYVVEQGDPSGQLIRVNLEDEPGAPRGTKVSF